jgi:hypothetical protein
MTDADRYNFIKQFLVIEPVKFRDDIKLLRANFYLSVGTLKSDNVDDAVDALIQEASSCGTMPFEW